MYALLWAVGQRPDVVVVLLFAFGLGNLNTIAIDLVRLRLSGYRVVYDWLIFVRRNFVSFPCSSY